MRVQEQYGVAPICFYIKTGIGFSRRGSGPPMEHCFRRVQKAWRLLAKTTNSEIFAFSTGDCSPDLILAAGTKEVAEDMANNYGQQLRKMEPGGPVATWWKWIGCWDWCPWTPWALNLKKQLGLKREPLLDNGRPADESEAHTSHLKIYDEVAEEALAAGLFDRDLGEVWNMLSRQCTDRIRQLTPNAEGCGLVWDVPQPWALETRLVSTKVISH